MANGGSFLLALVVGFSGGILCRSFFIVGLPYILFSLLICTIFLVSWLRWRRHAYLLLALLCMMFALGIFRTSLVPTTPSSDLQSKEGQEVVLTGKITEIPDIRESSQRLTVQTEKEKVLAIAQLFPEISYGETVEVRGIVARPESFDTGGGRVFNYDKFLAKDGIFVLLNNAHVAKVDGRLTVRDHLFGFLTDVRTTFIEGLERALPEPHAGLASGMLVGGKQGLGKTLLDVFTVTGLVHIVVLSGYNIMIIAEAVMRSTSFLPRRGALVISFILVAAFVFAAGAGSAALRAGIMAGVALFARATGNTYNALRALAAAALLMLVVNPFLLAFDPGFQLSIIATLGLILGGPLIEQFISIIKPVLVREVLATTMAAQLFVLPLLLFQTGNLSLVTLPANILILPAVPIAMLLAFIAGCVALIAGSIGPYVGIPAYLVLTYVIAAAELLASLPFASVILPTFPFMLVVVVYTGIALGVYFLTRKNDVCE